MKRKKRLIKGEVQAGASDKWGPRTPDPGWEEIQERLRKEKEERELAQAIRETADVVMRWKDLEGILAAYIQPILSQLSRMEGDLQGLKHDLVIHQAEQSVDRFREKLDAVLRNRGQSSTLFASESPQKEVPSPVLRSLRAKSKKWKKTYALDVLSREKGKERFGWRHPKGGEFQIEVIGAGGSGMGKPSQRMLKRLRAEAKRNEKLGRGPVVKASSMNEVFKSIALHGKGSPKTKRAAESYVKKHLTGKSKPGGKGKVSKVLFKDMVSLQKKLTKAGRGR